MALVGAVIHSWPLAALGLVILGLLVRLVARPTQLRRNGVPLRKPRDSLPFLGNGVVFLQPRQTLFSWFSQREREFGYETYQISVPSLPPGVVINDPANLDYVFKNEALFQKGDFVRRRSWDLFGHGIINADGDLWKAQRKAGLHFLSVPNMRVLTDVALPRYLSASIELLERHADSGEAVDMQTVFHQITSQLMGKMAYNMEMHADDDFTVAFDYASGVTGERFQNPLYALTELVTGSRFRRSLRVIKSYGKRIVAKAVRDRRSAASAQSEKDALLETSGSLMQSLLDSIEDETIVADAALNYLSAGRDTVAQALTWSLYMLMRQGHQDAMERIRDEAREALGTQNLPHDPARLTPATMPYTMAVFYEVMRLYPPIPIEIRQCVGAATLPDGTFIPESSVLLWSIWAMGRSQTTWGPDADVFRPDRWLSPTSSGGPSVFVSRSASEFPVFNGGSHTCLGKKMAELVVVQVLPVVTCAFEFRPAYDERYERVSKNSLTLPMEGGLPCFVTRR
ncbi:hypothetical protein MAPG_11766 [Magnaporthiopsis poae ATCC 64411]|uniref:Cytochrome P450 n=1 Tax=Magnaporthiopsis poae (strain ATCC 64411 / 73-15) TaxID=644358 RepID=A0A0C4EG46_MAGP6|nr:hypothetical protein MAPG_11766 [Magnaporthiopsis poae ATCC 64411]